MRRTRSLSWTTALEASPAASLNKLARTKQQRQSSNYAWQPFPQRIIHTMLKGSVEPQLQQNCFVLFLCRKQTAKRRFRGSLQDQHDSSFVLSFTEIKCAQHRNPSPCNTHTHTLLPQSSLAVFLFRPNIVPAAMKVVL